MKYLFWLAGRLERGEVSAERTEAGCDNEEGDNEGFRDRESDLAAFFTHVLHFSTHLLSLCVRDVSVSVLVCLNLNN